MVEMCKDESTVGEEKRKHEARSTGTGREEKDNFLAGELVVYRTVPGQ